MTYLLFRYENTNTIQHNKFMLSPHIKVEIWEKEGILRFEYKSSYRNFLEERCNTNNTLIFRITVSFIINQSINYRKVKGHYATCLF